MAKMARGAESESNWFLRALERLFLSQLVAAFPTPH